MTSTLDRRDTHLNIGVLNLCFILLSKFGKIGQTCCLTIG
jgi:hypothetical protein